MMATRVFLRLVIKLGAAVVVVVSISAGVSSALQKDNGRRLRQPRVSFGNPHHRTIQTDWSTLAGHGLRQQVSVPKEAVGDSRSADGVGLAGHIPSTPHVQNSRHSQLDAFTGWQRSPSLVHIRSASRSSSAQHTLISRRGSPQMISMVSENAAARLGGQRSPDLPKASRGRAGGERSGIPDPWVVPRNVRVKRSELQQGRLDLAELAKKVLSGEMAREKLVYEPYNNLGSSTAWVMLESGVEQADRSDSGVARAFRRLFPKGTVYNARDGDEKFRRVGVGKLLGVGSWGVVSLVQDMTNLAAALNFAGKFFYVALKSDAPHHIEA
ncbi:serine threonine-protein, partial [Cystoisospora suis]